MQLVGHREIPRRDSVIALKKGNREILKKNYDEKV